MASLARTGSLGSRARERSPVARQAEDREALRASSCSACRSRACTETQQQRQASSALRASSCDACRSRLFTEQQQQRQAASSSHSASRSPRRSLTWKGTTSGPTAALYGGGGASPSSRSPRKSPAAVPVSSDYWAADLAEQGFGADDPYVRQVHGSAGHDQAAAAAADAALARGASGRGSPSLQRRAGTRSSFKVAGPPSEEEPRGQVVWQRKMTKAYSGENRSARVATDSQASIRVDNPGVSRYNGQYSCTVHRLELMDWERTIEVEFTAYGDMSLGFLQNPSDSRLWWGLTKATMAGSSLEVSNAKSCYEGVLKFHVPTGQPTANTVSFIYGRRGFSELKVQLRAPASDSAVTGRKSISGAAVSGRRSIVSNVPPPGRMGSHRTSITSTSMPNAYLRVAAGEPDVPVSLRLPMAPESTELTTGASAPSFGPSESVLDPDSMMEGDSSACESSILNSDSDSDDGRTTPRAGPRHQQSWLDFMWNMTGYSADV